MDEDTHADKAIEEMERENPELGKQRTDHSFVKPLALGGAGQAQDAQGGHVRDLYATICDVLIVVLKFGGITAHSFSLPRTVLQ